MMKFLTSPCATASPGMNCKKVIKISYITIIRGAFSVVQSQFIFHCVKHMCRVVI